MKNAADHPPALCARFHRSIELIGRRWTGAIIYLLLRSRCRFAALRDGIPAITDRMLSERLQELEAEGIIDRTVVPDTPVRVEYALTRKGRALATAVEAIAEWSAQWTDIAEPPGACPPSKRSRVGARARQSAPRPGTAARTLG